jgi:hypothetical protein
MQCGKKEFLLDNLVGAGEQTGPAAPMPSTDVSGHNRIYALFAQPTPSQISKRETVTTDIAVEITTAEDTIWTCTLYCCAIM